MKNYWLDKHKTLNIYDEILEPFSSFPTRDILTRYGKFLLKAQANKSAWKELTRSEIMARYAKRQDKNGSSN